MTKDGTVIDEFVASNPAASGRDAIRRLVQICALCNDSRISYNEDNGVYSAVGEPTEAALKVLVDKLGSGDEAFDNSIRGHTTSARLGAVNEYLAEKSQRLLEFEFSRDRKSMSVLVKTNGSASLLVKGAPESILERCSTISGADKSSAPFTDAMRRKVQDRIDDYARNGLRVLALAYVDNVDADASHYRTQSSSDYVKFEQNMTFVGLVGMLDPPRPEVRGAIAKCRSAGIRIMVITGDNKSTAETICRQIGVFGVREELAGKSYTGKEFDALSQSEKIQAVKTASLFSRTEPGHKRQLVDLLQELGLVVAMTGDGVNDAPALKRASIGIAMGSGTDGGASLFHAERLQLKYLDDSR